jgi:general secretion pathway protein I
MLRRNSDARIPPQRGFTLLEVLVALAVLAIAMAALIKGGADNARAAAYLRDKTLAQWVAMNVVAEQRLAAAWPAPGKQRGSEEMARHEWYWELTVAETFDDDIRRLEVAVRATDDKAAGPLVNLVAFLPRPAASPAQAANPGAGQ